MKRLINLTCALLLGLAFAQVAAEAATTATDGTATLYVTLTDPPGNFNRRVDAFWITDSAGRFIVTVRKDAAAEQSYLLQWNAARGTSTVVDGYSGATITTWTPMSVPWNCRDANNALVPDGTYKFYLEFTDHNGQGWWTTNGLSFTKGTTAYTNTYPDQQYITAMSIGYVPAAVPHDIAIAGITPTTVYADTNATMRVAVTNNTATTEANVSVTLSNTTSGVRIGSQAISSLPGNTVTNLSFQWNTTNLVGNYLLTAVASPVAGETSTADNTLSATVAVQRIVHDIAVLSISPNTAQANTNVPVQVTVTNKTANAESFSVILTNVTSGGTIGTQAVNSLAGNRSTTLSFQWSTTNLQGNYVLRAIAGPVAGETSTADNTLDNTIVVQAVAHDIAVTAISPSLVQPNTNATMTVSVANKTVNAETFSVMLSNSTSRAVIGTRSVGPLAGNASTNVTFTWSTTNLSGTYTLLASAGPVAGEVVTADNTLTSAVMVRAPVHDVAINSIIAPATVAPDSPASISVVATNAGETAESFGVQLFDDTDGLAIGSTYQVSALAPAGSLAVPFTWNATNSSLGTHTLRAVALPVPGETALANNTNTVTVTVRTVTHDVGVAGIIAPVLVAPNSSTVLGVIATNAGETAESFVLQLFDDTDARRIGANCQVTNLAAASATNVSFTWLTTNSSLGYHTLRAVALPVPGETALANNTNTLLIAVASGMGTNNLIARGGTWRYNDQGLDLTQTPWRLPDYYDAVWAQGAAPLGYSADGKLTNINTTLSWGPVSTNKYSTYYLRREFYADALPSSLTVNVRCVDGVVLYLNGTELARFNMPDGIVDYAQLAAAPVTSTNQYAFTSAAVPTAGVVLGRNVLAAEVHRADPTGAGLVFDLEMQSVAPQSTASHRVDASSLSAPADALQGDQVPVAVTVTNRGNVTETVLVLLKDSVTGATLGVQTLSNLVPGSSAVAEFNWGTVGATNGVHGLTAYTVVGGVTNLAGAASNTVLISGSGFTTNTAGTTITGIGGRCGAVATTSSLLLLGQGATLEVWNRTNASAPVKQGSVRLPGLIQGLAVNGSYAYAACGQAGVQFVDISSPTQPVRRLSFNSSGQAYAVAATSGYLYIADGTAGLRIIKVTTPTAPVLAGAYYTPGPARAVALSSSRAYVLDQQEGLLILDVSNPAAPVLRGKYANFAAGQELAVSGSYAYLVDGNNHFAVVNVTNPASPSLAGSLIVNNLIGQDLVVNGRTVYIAGGASGLVTINVATPSAPVLVSTTTLSGEAAALALSGSRLYVASGFAGLQVLNVSSASAPALQSQFPSALRGADVVLTNNLAYVAAGEAGLEIFSVSSSSSPSLTGRLPSISNARALALSGGIAYVGDGANGLKVVDVNSATGPVLVGSYTNSVLGSIRDIGASGSMVVASDGYRLLLLNVSVRSNTRPVTLSGIAPLGAPYVPSSFVFSLAVDNGRAYLACGNAGLRILNLSSGGLSPTGTLRLPSMVTDVFASGGKAYLAGPNSGWWTVDVSNPSSPHISQGSTAQGPVLGLAASGTNLVLLTATNSAVTVNPTALTPVPLGVFAPLVNALRVAATSSLGCTAEDEAGLGLFAYAITGHDDDHLENATPAVDRALFTGTTEPPYAVAAGAFFPTPSVMQALQTSPDGSGIQIRWQSTSGQTYTIYRSTDLRAGFTAFQSNIPATPPINTATDSLTNGAAFYVIVAQ